MNTFLNREGSPTVLPGEVIRATEEEKHRQIRTLEHLHAAARGRSAEGLSRLQEAAVHNDNMFAVLMDVARYCSLGQMTDALFEVGGQYRRNM